MFLSYTDLPELPSPSREVGQLVNSDNEEQRDHHTTNNHGKIVSVWFFSSFTLDISVIL